jgi:hypothetical protein
MASSEEESSKGFKIQDRRRFSAEGELKPEFSGADEPSAKPDAPRVSAAPGARANPPSQPQPTEQAASTPQQAAAAQGYAAARSAAGAEGHPSAAGEITFGTFLMSLSTEALVHLGEMPDPAGGQPQPDLAMAQQLVDILGMLRDKTRGNLDHDEQALLDAILFDLRMKYVEIARRNS